MFQILFIIKYLYMCASCLCLFEILITEKYYIYYNSLIINYSKILRYIILSKLYKIK